MSNFETLGDRMKDYEMRSSSYLARRTYTVIRLDGKAFHTFTKGFKRPFDEDLINMMDETAKALCEQIQGVKLAYVQSDEITLVLTDFDSLKTDAWFDGNVQKIVSVSASIATAAFNNELLKLGLKNNSEGYIKQITENGLKIANFDSRVFTVPSATEVKNCLTWRQEDATKNSISMVAQSFYSAKELHGKNGNEKQEMIFQKGINWNDLPVGQKRGRAVIRKKQEGSAINKKTGETITFMRNAWTIVDPPIFTSLEGNAFIEIALAVKSE